MFRLPIPLPPRHENLSSEPIAGDLFYAATRLKYAATHSSDAGHKAHDSPNMMIHTNGRQYAEAAKYAHDPPNVEPLIVKSANGEINACFWRFAWLGWCRTIGHADAGAFFPCKAGLLDERGRRIPAASAMVVALVVSHSSNRAIDNRFSIADFSSLHREITQRGQKLHGFWSISAHDRRVRGASAPCDATQFPA